MHYMQLRDSAPKIHYRAIVDNHLPLPIAILYIPNSTSFPNGASDNPAILKCSLPHGIPTIVMQSNNPKNTCIIHTHRPPNINQRIFRGMRMQPVVLLVSLTFDPNGHKHKRPIMNVCKAIGMPIMVIANAKLPVK